MNSRIDAEQTLLNRLAAQLIIWHRCPEYFTLFEPEISAGRNDREKAEAKKAVIKARYPKFYKEIFEEAAETETEGI